MRRPARAGVERSSLGSMRLPVVSFVVIALGVLATPTSAAAAEGCGAPEGGWQTRSPAAVGMDPAGVEAAIEFGMEHSSNTVRVYRFGCKVGAEPSLPPDSKYESWSLAKSITALAFGRAQTLGLISADDPLGSLIPEADQAHGEIVMHDLLTMTSGLKWNGFRDYNILMPNRLQEALTVPVEKEPGTYWEYSQSGPALLAESVARASGEDFQAFVQRELFGPIGIDPGDWFWKRDSAGHTQGFFGLNMATDDFARLGELMRRGGVWEGKRLLQRRFVRDAVTPTPTSGCYGYLIWLNASKPCVSPRITDRPVDDARMFPSLPGDTYQYAGLFGQWVTVFPSYGIIVARNGTDTGSISGGSAWQEEMYRMVLESVEEPPAKLPPARPDVKAASDEDVDRGFFEALSDPAAYSGGMNPPPLPAAGPARARAVLINFPSRRVDRHGRIDVRLRCPREWTAPGLPPRCVGLARLTGAATRLRYRIPAGKTELLEFGLRQGALAKLSAKDRLRATIRTRGVDAVAGTLASHTVRLRPKG